MGTLISIEDAMKVMAGRCPFFWVFLDAEHSADWNDTVTEYNGLEDDIDNGVLYGILSCPVRPRPETRP